LDVDGVGSVGPPALALILSPSPGGLVGAASAVSGTTSCSRLETVESPHHSGGACMHLAAVVVVVRRRQRALAG